MILTSANGERNEAARENGERDRSPKVFRKCPLRPRPSGMKTNNAVPFETERRRIAVVVIDFPRRLPIAESNFGIGINDMNQAAIAGLLISTIEINDVIILDAAILNNVIVEGATCQDIRVMGADIYLSIRVFVAQSLQDCCYIEYIAECAEALDKDALHCLEYHIMVSHNECSNDIGGSQPRPSIKLPSSA